MVSFLYPLLHAEELCSMLWCLKDLSVEEISHSVLSQMVDFANAAGSLTTTKGGAIPALPPIEEIRVCRQKE